MVNERFAEAREKYQQLESKPDHVREILAAGGRKARQAAKITMARVRDSLGILVNR